MIVAAAALAVLLLLLLVLRSTRSRPRDRGVESERVLLVPEAPPEDVGVASSSSILGVDPQGPPDRVRPAAIILLLLIVAGFVGYALFARSPSEAGPAARGSEPREVAGGEDQPVRQTVTGLLEGELVEDEPTQVVVDEARGLRMISWSGNQQRGEPARPLRRALAVVVRDSLGRPVEGVEIRFEPAEEGGRTDPDRVLTNELGLATSTWRLGQVEDSLRVNVRAAESGDLSLRFTASFTEEGRQTAQREPVPTETETPGAAGEAGPETRPSPRPLAALRPRASLAVGGIHTCQLTRQGEATCWGAEEGSGQDGEMTLPSGRQTLRTVVAGVFHTCGLTGHGTILCWPARARDAANPAAPAGPITLPGDAIPVDVVAGSEHSCALASNGSVFCWGRNTHGQLGNGTTDDSREPVRVQDLPPAAQLSTGWLHTCALGRDGRPYCWGANASGQLGDGSHSDRRVAQSTSTDQTFSMLTAGSAHTCARTTGGAVLCWGANGSGQLGIGTTEPSARPLAVRSGVSFETVVAGGTHTCGLSPEGGAWCWGGNVFGQLGDGTFSSSTVPTPVLGSEDFVALEAGGAHTCAQDADEQMYCWGNNLQGQLGDGTRENRSRPVRADSELRRRAN